MATGCGAKLSMGEMSSYAVFVNSHAKDHGHCLIDGQPGQPIIIDAPGG
jgi:hypothetical protein